MIYLFLWLIAAVSSFYLLKNYIEAILFVYTDLLDSYSARFFYL